MPYKDPAVAKQKQAEWYQKNKEAVNKKHAEYYQKNKEAVLEQQAQYREENKEAVAEYNAKYRKDHKQNITYIITIGDYYYIGHTSQGLDARRGAHFKDLKAGNGPPGLRELFDDIGDEAFKKAFDIQILETFNTKEEAILAERKLLEDNVGKPGCLNKQLW